MFNLYPNASITIKYEDEDGDFVNITSDPELKVC